MVAKKVGPWETAWAKMSEDGEFEVKSLEMLTSTVPFGLFTGAAHLATVAASLTNNGLCSRVAEVGSVVGSAFLKQSILEDLKEILGATGERWNYTHTSRLHDRDSVPGEDERHQLLTQLAKFYRKKGEHMSPISVTVTPAYGRDYKSAKTAKAAWNEEKDFVIASLFGGQAGRYITKTEAEKAGFSTVHIRYKNNTCVTVVKVKQGLTKQRDGGG